MKKSNKSLVTMMVAMFMVIILIAGCSNGNIAVNQPNTTNENSTPSNNEQPGVEQPAVEEVKLDNPNITILYHTSKEQYEENKAGNPAAYDALWETVPQFEENYGGKVNVIAVPWGDQKSTLISMVNAGDQVDVAQANDQNFPVYPLKKMVQPLDDYIDFTDPLWNEAVTNAFKFGGKPYAIGTDATPIVIYYNKTLFENDGVKTPAEYVAEGNWTWETFRETANEMTHDDQFGFGWWDFGYALMVGSNGKTLLSYNDDGSITTNYDSENIKQAIQFTQDALLKDKFIDGSKEGDYFFAEFKNGKLAMSAEYGLGGFNAFKSDYEIDFVQVPVGPLGTAGAGLGGLSGWSIPTVAKNPHGAAEFIRMMSVNASEVANTANVSLYGQEKVEALNELSKSILFAPIGVEQYWDANGQVIAGIKEGTPVGTFSAVAKNILEEGIKITQTQ